MTISTTQRTAMTMVRTEMSRLDHIGKKGSKHDRSRSQLDDCNDQVRLMGLFGPPKSRVRPRPNWEAPNSSR